MVEGKWSGLQYKYLTSFSDEPLLSPQTAISNLPVTSLLPPSLIPALLPLVPATMEMAKVVLLGQTVTPICSTIKLTILALSTLGVKLVHPTLENSTSLLFLSFGVGQTLMLSAQSLLLVTQMLLCLLTTGQANMSPLDAVFLWEQYMEPLRSQGYRLGSAATSSNPNGMNWMNEFFTTCNGGCKPDFMAIHWYGIDADEFKTYVEQWHNTFSLPIWVTEVGYENFNGNDQGNLSEIQSFMSDVTSWMDLQDFIEKFCWSSGTPGSLNGLMNADGTPSSLGYQFIYSG